MIDYIIRLIILKSRPLVPPSWHSHSRCSICPSQAIIIGPCRPFCSCASTTIFGVLSTRTHMPFTWLTHTSNGESKSYLALSFSIVQWSFWGSDWVCFLSSNRFSWVEWRVCRACCCFCLVSWVFLRYLLLIFIDNVCLFFWRWSQVCFRWLRFHLPVLLFFWFYLLWVGGLVCVLWVCFFSWGRLQVCSFRGLFVRRLWLFCVLLFVLLWVSCRTWVKFLYETCRGIVLWVLVLVCCSCPAILNLFSYVLPGGCLCIPDSVVGVLKVLLVRWVGVVIWFLLVFFLFLLPWARGCSWGSVPPFWGRRVCRCCIFEACFRWILFSSSPLDCFSLFIFSNLAVFKVICCRLYDGFLLFLIFVFSKGLEVVVIAGKDRFRIFFYARFGCVSFWSESFLFWLCARSRRSNSFASWIRGGFRCSSRLFCRWRSDSSCCASCPAAYWLFRLSVRIFMIFGPFLVDRTGCYLLLANFVCLWFPVVLIDVLTVNCLRVGLDTNWVHWRRRLLLFLRSIWFCLWFPECGECYLCSFVADEL